MDEHDSTMHRKWDRSWHVAFIPTCRRKPLRVQLQRYVGVVFRKRLNKRGAGSTGVIRYPAIFT
jgi:hypothetical protein